MAPGIAMLTIPSFMPVDSHNVSSTSTFRDHSSVTSTATSPMDTPPSMSSTLPRRRMADFLFDAEQQSDAAAAAISHPSSDSSNPSLSRSFTRRRYADYLFDSSIPSLDSSFARRRYADYLFDELIMDDFQELSDVKGATRIIRGEAVLRGEPVYLGRASVLW